MSEPAPLPIDAPASTPAPSANPTPAPAPPPSPSPAAGDSLDFFSAIEQRFADAPEPTSPTPAPSDTPEPAPPEPEPSRAESPKAKDFKLVKAAKEAAEAKAAQLEARVKELEDAVSQAQTNPEYEAAKARLTEVEKELAAHRIEATPEYERTINEPIKKITAATDHLVAKYGLEKERLIDAFAEADPAKQTDLVSELASGMNELDRMRFYQMVDDFTQVLMKREQLRANAEAAWAEIQQNRKAAEEAKKKQSVEDWKKTTDEVWAKLSSKIPDFASLPKIDDLKKTVLDSAESDLPTDMRVYSLASAHLVPTLSNKIKAQQAEIAELKTSLAKYQASTPGAGGGGSSTSDVDIGSDVGFLDAIESRFGGR